MLGLRSELRRVGYWLIGCLWLFLVVALFLDLLHVEHAFHAVHLALAIVGGIFAILAMVEAHRAFSKAEEVQEAIGSFRMSFSAVLEEMVRVIRHAKEVSVLVPTPGYGFLFGQRDLSTQFVDAIENLVNERGGKIVLYLVVGNSHPVSESVPQQYLWRAYWDTSASVRQTYAEYQALVERVFCLREKHPQKISFHLLESDPSVRIVLADVKDAEKRTCLLSFAQLEALNTERPFEAKGFVSKRPEMVSAVEDLLMVYNSSRGRKETCDDRSLFTTLVS